MNRIVVGQFFVYHITDILGQLTANQFVIDVESGPGRKGLYSKLIQ